MAWLFLSIVGVVAALVCLEDGCEGGEADRFCATSMSKRMTSWLVMNCCDHRSFGFGTFGHRSVDGSAVLFAIMRYLATRLRPISVPIPSIAPDRTRRQHVSIQRLGMSRLAPNILFFEPRQVLTRSLFHSRPFAAMIISIMS